MEKTKKLSIPIFDYGMKNTLMIPAKTQPFSKFLDFEFG